MCTRKALEKHTNLEINKKIKVRSSTTFPTLLSLGVVAIQLNAILFKEALAQRCCVKKVFLKFCEIHSKTPVPKFLF